MKSAWFRGQVIYQRNATLLFDFVEAENTTGFLAPHESTRILMLSLDYSRMGQQKLSSLIGK